MKNYILIIFIAFFLNACMGSGTSLVTEQEISNYKQNEINRLYKLRGYEENLDRDNISNMRGWPLRNKNEIITAVCKKINSKYTHWQSYSTFWDSNHPVCLYKGERIVNHKIIQDKKNETKDEIIARAKETCIELGFKVDTPEIANCSLEIYKTESQIASSKEIKNNEDNLNSSLLLLQMGAGLLNANKPKLTCKETFIGQVSCF